MYSIPDFAGSSNSGSAPTSPIRFGNDGAGGAGGGTNQWMNYPSMGGSYSPTGGYPMPSSSYPPGIVPPATSGPYPSTPGPIGKGGVGATNKLPGNQETVPTIDPFYSGAYGDWLATQLGTGMTPFDLSSILPSSGKTTAPGTLTAPENQIMQSLQNFYMTGQGGPLPGVLPMWEAEMGAMQQPIQQNLANLREQFGSMGALGSTEMGTAMENYLSQTSADEMALLTSATQQALPGMASFGGGLQQLDQSSIANLLNEFQRVQPQNNPLLNLEQSFATTYPPSYGKSGFTQAFGQALGSGLGSGLAGDITGQSVKGYKV